MYRFVGLLPEVGDEFTGLRFLSSGGEAKKSADARESKKRRIAHSEEFVPDFGDLLEGGLDTVFGSFSAELAFFDCGCDSLSRFRPRRNKVGNDESSDTNALRDDVEVVVQVDGSRGILVRADATALCDTRELGHLREDVVQDFTTNYKSQVRSVRHHMKDQSIERGRTVVEVQVAEFTVESLVEIFLPGFTLVVDATTSWIRCEVG